jgi:hypothetical protein
MYIYIHICRPTPFFRPMVSAPLILAGGLRDVGRQHILRDTLAMKTGIYNIISNSGIYIYVYIYIYISGFTVVLQLEYTFGTVVYTVGIYSWNIQLEYTVGIYSWNIHSPDVLQLEYTLYNG